MTQNGQERNRIIPRDESFHDWYRFVLAYPPHLVQGYLRAFHVEPGQVVLDPFCGTGTTLIEAKLSGIESVGIEANPFARFASAVKVDWSLDPDTLRTACALVADATRASLREEGIDDDKPFDGEVLGLRALDCAADKLLITGSMSPAPLHKTLMLLDCLHEHANERYYGHALLALANAAVYSISNLRFGPEVGVGRARVDVPVLSAWLAEVERMALDLRLVAGQAYPPATVHLADARQASSVLAPESVDAVITSPPYPNEKDYTRTTRLESVLLGLITDKQALQKFKKRLVRSNTRVVYRDDDDDKWVADNPDINRIAAEIERRRVELGKTSGFERLYARVTRLYFGGMARHLADLSTVLRPGAQLAYVVGDQASYLRVMIRTGQLLADIAEHLGYEPLRIDLFRTRFSTATKEQLREEVVILKWPGKKGITSMVQKQPKDDNAQTPNGAPARPNRYSQLILEIWRNRYTPGSTSFEFQRQELVDAAAKLGLTLPKNLGDVLYTFRYRGSLPKEIADTATEDRQWAINPAGRGKYRFELVREANIVPNPALIETKVPDATPGVISIYALTDEQALLAKLRYNRLIDIFTGLTCYSLQNHLRTTVAEVGQVETDEIYIGLDKRGVHYVLPVQAKGGRDRLGTVQIMQDFAMAQEKWPHLVCRLIAAQFMADNLIAMFELGWSNGNIGIVAEKHYRLVSPDDLTDSELASYRNQPE